jgi:hypothetical protein
MTSPRVEGVLAAELRRQAAAVAASQAAASGSTTWLPLALQQHPPALSPTQRLDSIAARLSRSSSGVGAEQLSPQPPSGAAAVDTSLAPPPSSGSGGTTADVLSELHAALQAVTLDARGAAEADARCASLQTRLFELQRRLLASEAECAELQEEVAALEAERDAARALAASEVHKAQAAQVGEQDASARASLRVGEALVQRDEAQRRVSELEGQVQNLQQQLAAVAAERAAQHHQPPERSDEAVAVLDAALRDANGRLQQAEADAASWRRRADELHGASPGAISHGSHVAEMDALRRDLTATRAQCARLEIALRDADARAAAAEARAAVHQAGDAALQQAATAAEAAVMSVEHELGPALERERARADAAHAAATQASMDAASCIEQLLRAVSARESDVASREAETWARERQAFEAGMQAGLAAATPAPPVYATQYGVADTPARYGAGRGTEDDWTHAAAATVMGPPAATRWAMHPPETPWEATGTAMRTERRRLGDASAQAAPASGLSPGASAKLRRLMESAAALRADLVSAVAAGAAARADAALARAQQRSQRDVSTGETPSPGAGAQ